MNLRIPTSSGLAKFLLGPVGRVLIMGSALLVILLLSVFTVFYARYSRVIDEKLNAGPFTNTAKIFAAPESVGIGDALSPNDIAAELRRSGYNESRSNPVGYYVLHPNEIEIFPQRDSYFDQEPGVIKFSGGRISQIVSLQDNTSRPEYQLEPQLITNLSGPSREKRRIVKFADIPPVLIQAVTSAEDKHFFQHAGFDPVRIIKAAYVDLRQGRKDQGASTLSQQLARMFFLYQEKRWTRKLAEMIITLQLEQKLSKEEIFEDYANQIYLGSRGTFRIHGFGEAADAFLGKDLSQINLPEAAELASLPRWPAYFDPFRHPDHLKERRNLVLGLMQQNGFISEHDYALAKDAPLTVAKGTAQSDEAPYFVDLVNDTLQTKFQDTDFQSHAFRVYTTLDLRLQRVAVDAVTAGMKLVDAQIKRQRRFRGQTPPEPQVALVAIDPHTAEVRAMVGGRNYGVSQLSHVLAKRQPGSIFKPFVYAAAMDTAIEGGPRILTPSTMVMDEPTTFWFDGNPYTPTNFKDEFEHKNVTLRWALAHSRNVPTVRVAEMVGYDAVVEMANRAGMNHDIKATPAVALGAYDVTPIEAAGAYTMFANQGVYVKPDFLTIVRDQDNNVLYRHHAEQKQVLDPRIAYMMTNLMEEVLRSGTGAGVRATFTAPAAGKTGTSRDGWFAGYTSELLCIVWVGFDDNRDLDLQGADSAAPIWAQFMKGALKYREYRDTKPFEAPDGIVTIDIDPASGMPAGPFCPERHPEVYIAGTQPVGSCPLHGGRVGATAVAGWETPPPAQPQPTPAESAPRITGSDGDGQTAQAAIARRAARQSPPDPPQRALPPPPEPAKKDTSTKKPGILRRLLNVFK
ncbi:MAG TPA: PBP1A family penicillin-binding protein [Bryobacteraceae bacterium]|nr:PBP1A family penicillin-binding protein [Bryobacteraceae bacterium]